MEEIDATFAADSSVSAGGAVAYEASSMMAGASAAIMAIVLRKQIIASMAATSAFSAMLDSDLTVSLTLLGAAGFLVDPTKVTIVNFSRGPQVPVTAKPITIPTIRIVPPSPPSASYSVGSPPRRTPKRGL